MPKVARALVGTAGVPRSSSTSGHFTLPGALSRYGAPLSRRQCELAPGKLMLPIYFIKAIGGLNGAIPSPLQALRRAIVGDFRVVKGPLGCRGS